ncbi:PPOX class probable F420-dependent enzyme [Pseudonocardia hierapolitana]|uniref:PPOX class probable F420-dependent enzyme n=1 Tax=Pseudonocardia hierapolitana TaxID=1128676 RepID=A0A561T2B1_9PSEU|nr:TIGR03668 family PPOX class F420-dependent oxidoreductase [Pseudonocardia hierapolitana]TWF81235.1 PPOX class probable F420-dependent enzyme [Pseudonocardia hierapolitana]
MPALDPAAMRSLAAAAPVARLATLRPDGTPRLVPITFVLVDGLICSAVDEVKPKTTTRLARLADVERDPRVGIVVDHYADDWSALWWVRVDGTAAVHGGGRLRERALDALVAKYPPYAVAPPSGRVLVVTPTRWAGWSATSPTSGETFHC